MRNGASLAGRGGLGLCTRLWLEEKSSREVWWSERLLGGAGPLTSPLPAPASLVLLKNAPNNYKIFLKGGQELI
jgi:hypothetical protein